MAYLQVDERAPTKPAKLREQGIVPMALIMHGSETQLIQAPLSDLRSVLLHTTGVGMFELQVKGETKKHTVIVKQVDQEIVGRKILHVSLMAIDKDEVLTMEVGIIGIGQPEPVRLQEGILGNPTSHVKLKGKATDLPQNVEVDVSGMLLHESITASQLTLASGVELASSADAVLFSLHPLRHVKEDEEPEAEAAPEVLGESDVQAESETAG